jgi:hypothetical protein
MHFQVAVAARPREFLHPQSGVAALWFSAFEVEAERR